jgi:hypothetical protein
MGVNLDVLHNSLDFHDLLYLSKPISGTWMEMVEVKNVIRLDLMDCPVGIRSIAIF